MTGYPPKESKEEPVIKPEYVKNAKETANTKSMEETVAEIPGFQAAIDYVTAYNSGIDNLNIALSPDPEYLTPDGRVGLLVNSADIGNMIAQIASIPEHLFVSKEMADFCRGSMVNNLMRLFHCQFMFGVAPKPADESEIPDRHISEVETSGIGKPLDQ